jgi:hypothetical protein
MEHRDVRGEFLSGEPDVENAAMLRIRDCNIVARHNSRELGGLGNNAVTESSSTSHYGLLQ